MEKQIISFEMDLAGVGVCEGEGGKLWMFTHTARVAFFSVRFFEETPRRRKLEITLQSPHSVP